MISYAVQTQVKPLDVKKSFKTQHGRIPIDPAILAVIGHCFIANKNNKLKFGYSATRNQTFLMPYLDPKRVNILILYTQQKLKPKQSQSVIL